MTQPPPPIEDRVSALEAEAVRLQARLVDLEAAMTQGLADLQVALNAINARRPPVRRELDELRERVDTVAPPTEGAGGQTGVPEVKR